MAHTDEEDLLEQVLYAYEKDVDPEQSMYRFQPDGVGPSLHSQRYKLVPQPSYRGRPKYCCSIRTAICLVLILLVLTAIIGLSVYYLRGGLPVRNPTNSEKFNGNSTVDRSASPSNTTQDHFDLMLRVMHPGAKINLGPLEMSQIPAVVVQEACGSSLCHRNASCSQGVCRCEPGLEGDGVISCLPVKFIQQNCQPGNKSCCCNSHCVRSSNDTLAAYTCQCKEGYERRGSRCVDTDECSLGTSQCPANSKCFNVSGSFRCLCDARDAVFDGSECRSRTTASLADASRNSTPSR